MTPAPGSCGSRLVWTRLLHFAKSVQASLDLQERIAAPVLPNYPPFSATSAPLRESLRWRWMESGQPIYPQFAMSRPA